MMFAGQRQWAHDPDTISRGSRTKNNHSRQLPCFNCEKPGCSIRKCKIPENFDNIRRSIAAWKRDQGLDKAQTNIAKLTKGAETDGQWLDDMIVIACERDESNNENNPRGAKEYILHNNQVETNDKNFPSLY